MTWEIGPPGKELTTPGGVYLLLQRLMAPARELMDDSSSLWAVWFRHGPGDGESCRNPFAKALDANLRNQPWMRERGIKADPVKGDAAENSPFLRLAIHLVDPVIGFLHAPSWCELPRVLR